MHPDRGIVLTYRRSDGLSTIPNDHNTLTCQSSNTNDTPRDPLHVHITVLCNPLSTPSLLVTMLIILVHFLCDVFPTLASLIIAVPHSAFSYIPIVVCFRIDKKSIIRQGPTYLQPRQLSPLPLYRGMGDPLEN